MEFIHFANIANPHSGLGEAAVMLQRAWNEDPQSLPFAPYIKAHALVSLVQKGLHYHELEHSIDKVRLVDLRSWFLHSTFVLDFIFLFIILIIYRREMPKPSRRQIISLGHWKHRKLPPKRAQTNQFRLRPRSMARS